MPDEEAKATDMANTGQKVMRRIFSWPVLGMVAAIPFAD